MAIDVNMQLSHMISDDLGIAGTESAIIDTLNIIRKEATEKDLPKLIENTLHIVVSTADIHRGVDRLYNEGRVYKEQDRILLSPTTIEELNATSLKNNYAVISSGYSIGGAIYNVGTVNGGAIGEISGNYAEGTSWALGGAIYNKSTDFKLDSITGEIKNNHVKSNSSYTYGGAIYNDGGNFGIITGAIEDNYAQGGSGMSYGGAIYNTGTIEELNATSIKNNYLILGQYDEDGNYVSGGGWGYGGAIYNTGTVNGGKIGEISGNYVKTGRSSSSSGTGAFGGAIYNTSSNFKLDSITGDIKITMYLAIKLKVALYIMKTVI